ncbi:MAG: DUF2784 domain-containing protein [Chromatiaceae bacterium]|nr:DUF2784 domain-containing protein [Chromatiaceae bacterium]
MLAALAADLLVLLHLGFIVFVALGALLVLRWPVLAWLHVPTVLWGIGIELGSGLICPLTPLENSLRLAAGQAGYAGGFIDHYLVPLIYPPGLTRGMQIGLGLGVGVVNLLAYALLIARWRRARDQAGR